MSSAEDGNVRRRRRRAQRPAGPATPVAADAAVEDRRTSESPDAASTSSQPRQRSGRTEPSRRGRDSERGWRELAGNSPSQLGISGALRARDVARPGPDELAAAERDLQLVRRQWVPPADEPTIGR